MNCSPRQALAALFFAVFCLNEAPARKPDGRLVLTAVDAETGQPVAARMRLSNSRGRGVAAEKWAGGQALATIGEHAYFTGTIELALPRGAYRFDLDAGPEHRTRHGKFEIARHADDAKRVEVHRFANLAEEGWFAGDLATLLPADVAELGSRVERVEHTATVTHRWDEGEWAPARGVERFKPPENSAGALWATEAGIAWLIDPSGGLSEGDLPDAELRGVELLLAARSAGWRVVAAAASADLPLWVAHEAVDAVAVLDDWIGSRAARGATAGLLERDKLRFPGADGEGRRRVWLYYQLIDAGVRLPPAGLSGAGLNEQPLGSSRAHAFTDGDASAPAWWTAFDEGAVVVTNGPLLRPVVEGEPPGAEFLLEPNRPRAFEIGLNLATRDVIEYLEIRKNGRTLHSVRLEELAGSGGKLPTVGFDQSGWFAIEAVASSNRRYVAAVSAPYYVLSPEGPRIGRKACRFWLETLEASRERHLAQQPRAYDHAVDFWAERLSRSVD